MRNLRHQILIASYRRDFEWLQYCLASLKKYCTGFLPPVVAVPAEDAHAARLVVRQSDCPAIVSVWNGPGFARAQEAMMSGDLLCPEADYFWLLGSDCLAVKPFSPANYCVATDKPIMLYNTWEHMEKHSPETLFWRAGVEKALGGKSHGEFMRRLPLAYPTRMMEPMRRAVAELHNTRFTPYIHHAVNVEKNFSESNVMGEYAWRFHQQDYHWVCIDDFKTEGFESWPASPIVQHWSHGGLDRPRDLDGRTPRSVIVEALY